MSERFDEAEAARRLGISKSTLTRERLRVGIFSFLAGRILPVVSPADNR